MELETQAAFDPASFEHIPVLLNECLEGLSIDPAGSWTMRPAAFPTVRMHRWTCE